MKTTIASLMFLTSLLSAEHAAAHYLWVIVASHGNKDAVANIYFEEGPAAGDGHYLDHFNKTSKTWIRTITKLDPPAILAKDTKEGEKRWLSVKLDDASPRSIDCYDKFGVYAYGKTNVLLHYYARYLDVSSHVDLHELGRAEQMNLDIVPHDMEEAVELRVLWKGKPTAGRTVYIRGPKKFRVNLKTDDDGQVRFEPKDPGRYTFRTSVEEPTPGEDGGKEYKLIRHNGTLVMKLPLKK